MIFLLINVDQNNGYCNANNRYFKLLVVDSLNLPIFNKIFMV